MRAFAMLAGVILAVGAGAATARASFPGTNGLIAAESGGPQPAAIVSVSPDGTGPAQIFGAASQIRRDPSWSADGRRLAFTAVVDGDEGVYVREPDGAVRPIAPSPASDTDPAFSPAGDRLAFTSTRDGDADIYTVSLDTGLVQQLTTDPAADRQPAWSVGDQIAFSTARDGDLDIWTMRSDGSAARPLTANERTDADPSWSPDGRRLAFTSGAPGAFGIFVVGDQGGAASRLALGASSHFPAWSPDGRRIAFAVDGLGSDFVMVTGAPGGPDTPSVPSSLPALDALGGYHTDPKWQPLPPPPEPEAPPPDADSISVSEARNGVTVAAGTATATATPRDPLLGAAVLPAASTVDATSGSVTITASSSAAPETGITATLRGGKFSTRRRQAGDPLFIRARLVLPVDCGPGASAARLPRGTYLRGRSNGPLRVAPNHGSASIPRTDWQVRETCRGTRYRVLEGAFDVFDGRGRRYHLDRANPTVTLPVRRR